MATTEASEAGTGMDVDMMMERGRRAFLLTVIELAHSLFVYSVFGKHRVVSAQFAQMVPLSQSSTYVLA